MDKQQQTPGVSRRALFVIVALTAAGILLGPDPTSVSDSHSRGFASEVIESSGVNAQARPELSRPRLDQRRDGRYRDLSGLPDPAGSPPPTSSNSIKVEFKLDPRVTSSAYMGDRWVSQRTYTRVQQGAVASIDCRAFVLDGNGADTKAIPEWTPANPEMVTVTAETGNLVVLTVKSSGESSLQVASQETSKTLTVKATADGGAIRVDITEN